MIDKPVAISLFSGAGGLDVGLEMAGYDVRCSIELNHDACETLRTNKMLPSLTATEFENWFNRVTSHVTYQSWPEAILARFRERLRVGRQHQLFKNLTIIEGDIRGVSSADCINAANLNGEKIELIAGGPPCQSFSRAGKRESVDDACGQLFMEFVRLVKELRPRWFLFENVKGLILTKTTVWKTACSSCNKTILPPFDNERYAPEHGSPAGPCPNCGSKKTKWQVDKDKRAGALELILAEFARAGYSCQYQVLNSANFGIPQMRERLFIVGSRDGENHLFPGQTHGEGTDDGQLSLWSSTLKPYCSVWDALFTERNPYHRWPIDPETAVLWVKNVVRPHDEPVTWSLSRPAPTIGAHQSAKLAIAPFGVPEEQLTRQQWHTLGRRQGDTKPVKFEHSYLSDEDLLKLQSFPYFWFIHGTRMERAFQIGNAVPPVLAEKVAGSLSRTKSLSLAMSA